MPYAPVEWLGANAISMTVVGYAVGQLEERFLSLNLPAKVGVLGLGFFVCDMIYYGITGLSKDVVTNLAEDVLFRNPFQGEGRIFSRVDATYSF